MTIRNLFNTNKLKDFGSSALAFGKRNAPSVMTGGGILIGWTAAYIFWKQGRKAEEKIRAEEAKLNENNESEAPEDQLKLPRKEKLTIYLQYCWTALALGLGSTGLTIWAHKIDLSRLAEMYMVTQFLEKKNDDQSKMLDKLKAEVSDKKIHELENDILEEDYPDDELRREILSVPGNGRTLFCDKTRFNYKFRAEIEDVKNGIYEFDDMMSKRYENAMERQRNNKKNRKTLQEKLKDPFFASDNPYSEDEDDEYDKYLASTVYVEATLDEFLEYIGEGGGPSGLGENMVIRYYGQGLCINPNSDSVMQYKDFVDPENGVAQFCRLDYTDFLVPSISFEDRRW